MSENFDEFSPFTACVVVPHGRAGDTMLSFPYGFVPITAPSLPRIWAWRHQDRVPGSLFWAHACPVRCAQPWRAGANSEHFANPHVGHSFSVGAEGALSWKCMCVCRGGENVVWAAHGLLSQWETHLKAFWSCSQGRMHAALSSSPLPVSCPFCPMLIHRASLNNNSAKGSGWDLRGWPQGTKSNTGF